MDRMVPKVASVVSVVLVAFCGCTCGEAEPPRTVEQASGEAPPPARPVPVSWEDRARDYWKIDGLVVLPRGADLEKHFWPLFDSLTEERIDAEFAAIMKEKPATGLEEASELRARRWREQDAEIAKVKEKAFLFRDSIILGAYDQAKGEFKIYLHNDLLSLIHRWELAFDRKPVVDRNVEETTDRWDRPVEKYDYYFVGKGKPPAMAIPIPAGQADAFEKRFGHDGAAQLDLEVVFRVTDAFEPGDLPLWGGKALRDPSNPLRGVKADGPGRALVAKVQGWRVLDPDGIALAKSERGGAVASGAH